MAGKPAEPPHPRQRPLGAEPRAADGSGALPADDRELERTGPIAFARHVKDDGRALILYFDERRAADPPRQT
jgi:hypothetical protein